MLPKTHRYPMTRGVPRNVLTSPLFTVRYTKNDSGLIRAAIVVSKKVSTKAVARNRIKRILSHILQGKNVQKEQGLDLVFFVKKAIVEKERSHIEKDVDALISKIYGTI